MADQEQLAAFSYHWRAAGLAETTLRYYLSWLRRLDVDDATTDDWLAAQLADMTPSSATTRCGRPGRGAVAGHRAGPHAQDAQGARARAADGHERMVA